MPERQRRGQIPAQGQASPRATPWVKCSIKSPSPAGAAEFSARSKGFSFLELPRQFRVGLTGVNKPHGSVCDHPVENVCIRQLVVGKLMGPVVADDQQSLRRAWEKYLRAQRSECPVRPFVQPVQRFKQRRPRMAGCGRWRWGRRSAVEAHPAATPARRRREAATPASETASRFRLPRRDSPLPSRDKAMT